MSEAELEGRLRALGLAEPAVRAAAADGELLRLAAERVLADDRRYTAEEVAERSGLPAEVFLAHAAAHGRPRPRPGEPAFGEEDVEGARLVQSFRAAGLADEELLDQARLFRFALDHIAEATLRLVTETAVRASRDETEFAVTMAELAEHLAPSAEPLLGWVLRIHLRQGLRAAVVTGADLAAGALPGTQEVTVCFADLTGFTATSERLEPEALGRLATRFGELAAAVTGSEVRLVKLLGDAAMLVSPDSDAVLAAAVELVRAAAAEDEGFPAVHAGVARGPALPRSGDWFGPPVNRASRLSSVATAGEIVVDEAVRGHSSPRRWRALGDRELKGIAGRVAAFALDPAKHGVPGPRVALDVDP